MDWGSLAGNLGDYANDLAGSATKAGQAYITGAVQAKLDRKTAPSAAPVSHVGPSGDGGSVALTPQPAKSGFWDGLPGWSKGLLIVSGSLLVLGVGLKLVSR